MARSLIGGTALLAALAPVRAGAQGPAGPAPGPPSAGTTANGAISGEQLFATMCGFCHQSGGRVVGKGPKLAGTDKTDAFIVNRIKNGKQGEMPAFGRAFTDEQVRAIVAYIRGLKDGAP